MTMFLHAVSQSFLLLEKSLKIQTLTALLYILHQEKVFNSVSYEIQLQYLSGNTSAVISLQAGNDLGGH